MGKKKKILKKVNPEKSNKMIYAVAVGLFMIFAGFIYLSVSSNPIEKRMGIINGECTSIERSDGVISATGTERTIEIVVDTEKHEDFKGLAVFRGKRLSNMFAGENMTIRVVDKNRKELFKMVFRNGRQLQDTKMSSVPAS